MARRYSAISGQTCTDQVLPSHGTQLTNDADGAPPWILSGDAQDQPLPLGGNVGTPRSATTLPAPVGALPRRKPASFRGGASSSVVRSWPLRLALIAVPPSPQFRFAVERVLIDNPWSRAYNPVQGLGREHPAVRPL